MEIIISNLGELLGGLAAFLTAIFGGIKLIVYYSNKGIHKKIDKFVQENLDQHESICKVLSIVEDSVVRKEVIDELRTIARGYIHYNKLIDDKAKILIDSQCERVVEVAEEIMNEHFTQDVLDQTIIKTEAGCAAGRRQVVELYGEEFLRRYSEIQIKAVETLMVKLRKIVEDKVTNSKYSKFKYAVVTFLHDMISETLLLMHDLETSNKK